MRSRCSSAAPVRPDRVRQSLSIYSAKDIAHMTTEEGIVTADCQFCGAHYEFDPRHSGSRPSFRPEARMGATIDLDTLQRAIARAVPRRRIST
jgi:hypothetical protein